MSLQFCPENYEFVEVGISTHAVVLISSGYYVMHRLLAQIWSLFFGGGFKGTNEKCQDILTRITCITDPKPQ